MSRRADFRSIVDRSRQVVLASAVVGALTGVVIAGFDRLTVDVVFDRGVAHLPLWLMAFAPGLGLIVAALWLRYPGRGVSPNTADEYLIAFHTRRGLGVRDMVARVVAAVATLGSGAAMGLEGPSIYMGATIGSALQRRWRSTLAGADSNLLLVAGAAAGIAAIFKAPATGAIFAIEVPFQEELARRMLLPALVAAASGYLALVAISGTTPLFPVHGSPPFSFVDLAGAAALGVAAGGGARLFAAMLRRAKRLATFEHRAARVVLCGVTIAALFAIGRGLTGESLVLTPGYGVVTWALAPNRSVALLLAVLMLRCLATGTAVAGGGVGGLFVPLVVAGALLGRAFGAAVGSTDSLFLVIGIAAFLGAGYRVPLAAIVFVAETTGRPGFVVPGLIAAVVAELVMSRMSVTEYQVRPEPGTAIPDDPGDE
ncbi:MAG TPA: chloride channel protein [Acidimicrobiia bacterium]|nr:chloride channel protein [Acidimicrobiia bacterium]